MVSAAAMAVAIGIVRNGVDWSSKHGGVCPRCAHKRCKVTRSMPWDGDTRVRYHACQKCGTVFKSLETDRDKTG